MIELIFLIGLIFAVDDVSNTKPVWQQELENINRFGGYTQDIVELRELRKEGLGRVCEISR